MKAEIITIGNELLSGSNDTNSAWIAEILNNAGIEIYQVTTIPDSKCRIIKALKDSEIRADIIITTGGLGPTSDDVTMQALCEYFNCKTIIDKDTLKDIKIFFRNRKLPLTSVNKKQAEIPEVCLPIRNVMGTAPGLLFNKKKKLIVALPGVPFEMKAMMGNHVVPYILKNFKTNTIIQKTILTTGIGESFLSDKIKSWEQKLPDRFSLAYLPSPGIVRLKLTAAGDENDSGRIFRQQIDELRNIISDYIFGYDDDKLEEIIGNLLKVKKMTLSTAESCSGGYIAHKITSIPWSSLYFKGSVVAYSNKIKTDVLKVKDQTLLKYGAVSRQVVTEMAKGAKKLLSTDFAIAVSGIAGPDGGTKNKPVGTVWIAIATPFDIISRNFLFGNNREGNICRTAVYAMNLLRQELIKIKIPPEKSGRI